MTKIQTISALVTGGNASSGPPLGPALGPLGVNIIEIINSINEKTKDFDGMKIPISVHVDSETKKWDIDVGIPSTSALIFKEVGIKKGTSNSNEKLVGDISFNGIIKIAKVKFESSYARSLKSVSKEIIGTCLSCGIKIEDKSPSNIILEINENKWDQKLR